MQPKAGWKTTEFWMSVVAAFIPLVNQGFGLQIPTEAMIAVAGYAVSRGLAKRAQ